MAKILFNGMTFTMSVVGTDTTVIFQITFIQDRISETQDVSNNKQLAACGISYTRVGDQITFTGEQELTADLGSSKVTGKNWRIKKSAEDAKLEISFA